MTGEQPSAAALLDESVSARAKELAGQAVESARAHLDSPSAGATPPKESPWAKSWSRSQATASVARAVLETAPLIEQAEGTRLQKVWISRGDDKVRPLHRKLHGHVADLDKSFWRDLASGSELRYPGDSDGPVDQVAGCRCLLILSHADEAADVESALALPDAA